jgi:hypothetical protein
MVPEDVSWISTSIETPPDLRMAADSVALEKILLCHEGSHPPAEFFDERPRAHDTHTVTRPEVPDVVRDEQARAGTNRGGENRYVLRIGEFARSFTVVRCWTLDRKLNGPQEFLEKGRGLRELSGQVPSDLSHCSLREHQTKETKLAKHEDRMAGAGAGHEAGDQDVSIDTDR